jgi:Fur family peroxide stress response transcriptional regulator
LDVDDVNGRLDELVARLKEQGFRLTPQRKAVLQVLANDIHHPSVEQIYRQVKKDFPMTSLATVYKTVTVLKELGEVLELGFADGSNRYDGRKPNPHPHLICIQCNKILDPDVDGWRGLPQALSESTGFRILSHRLDFYGICPQCQKRKEPLSKGAGKSTARQAGRQEGRR